DPSSVRVAQIFNLPYRRISFCAASLRPRQSEIKRRAGAGSRVGPDPSAVSLNDVMDYHQTYSCSLERFIGMKFSKLLEEAPSGLRSEADAIVADRENPFLRVFYGADFNQGLRALAGIFERITEEIQHHLMKHRFVPFHLGKGVYFPDHPAIGSQGFQFVTRELNQRRHRDAARFDRVPFGVDEREVILDEALHLLRTRQNPDGHIVANGIAAD